MIQYGKSITKMSDPLYNIALQRLFQGIQNPKQQFKDQVEQLRMVNSINPTQYKLLKKQLPYFVCGIFHPPIRRKEHFSAIEYFILDLDHLAAFDLDKTTLLETICQHKEVVMAFTSPGADGLKIMFKLSEPCKDEALFSSFYKIFATRFASKLNLESVIDYRTSDVTRACFLSYDPNAYFNPDAIPINIEKFIPDFDFEKIEKDLKQAEKTIKINSANALVKAEPQANDAVLKMIRDKLNPNRRIVRKKQHFVPPEVDKALTLLEQKLAEFDLVIKSTQTINYGRKLMITAGQLWAELNIFYGKKGFKIVKTTKTGSNMELAELAQQAIESILLETDQ